MKKYFVLSALGLFLLSMSSCLVTKKKFDEQVALAEKLKAEKEDCNDKLNKANAEIEDLKGQIARLGNEIDQLKTSNASLEEKNKQLNKLKDESEQLCERVRQQLEQITKSSTAEKDKLLKDLAEREKDLLNKERELNQLTKELNERDAKVRELESLIARKDSAVQDLKRKMLEALTNFDAQDLTVYEKDGKVYIALSDKLLFGTGSFSVDKRGKEALMKISGVLNKNADISIMVEGHTDNKPYITSTNGPVNSNWDLSVMRASSVTKIMVDEYKVDSKRVTPAGRGEFFPVAGNDTPEGRSKNRRIDIVLTPDMKGIFNILNNTN